MSRSEFAISPTLRAFVDSFRASQLEAVTVESLRRLREHNPPTLRFFAGLPESGLIAHNVARLDAFLATLLDAVFWFSLPARSAVGAATADVR